MSPAGKGSATCTAKLRVILLLTQAAFLWCLAGACGGRRIPPEQTEWFYLLLLAPACECRVGMQQGRVCHSPQLSTQTQLILRG